MTRSFFFGKSRALHALVLMAAASLSGLINQAAAVTEVAEIIVAVEAADTDKVEAVAETVDLAEVVTIAVVVMIVEIVILTTKR